MKYNWTVTLTLVGLFLASQLVGLGLLYQETEVIKRLDPTTNQIVVHTQHSDTALGERPDVEGQEAFMFVIVGVLIGTGLVLILIRFAKLIIWKAFFFIAVWSTITISLGVLIDPTIALVIGFILGILKLWKHNVVVHNLTELLMYGGIAVLFVPLFSTTSGIGKTGFDGIFWIVALLLVISVYDAFAVWKSKHMVSMAEFQTSSKAFAGLMVSAGRIPKRKIKKAVKKRMPKKPRLVKKQVEGRSAILGGGDIAFPLIFSGVVLEMLVNTFQLTKEAALLRVLIIPIILSAVLLLLLTKGKEGHYYPAMPFITAGALLGYGIVMLTV